MYRDFCYYAFLCYTIYQTYVTLLVYITGDDTSVNHIYIIIPGCLRRYGCYIHFVVAVRCNSHDKKNTKEIELVKQNNGWNGTVPKTVLTSRMVDVISCYDISYAMIYIYNTINGECKWVATTCLVVQEEKLGCLCEWSLKTEIRHDANFVATGSTTDCHNNNLWCHRWRQSKHYDNCCF